ncbi:unnamed protein product, partial [Arabidopsis halleri]
FTICDGRKLFYYGDIGDGSIDLEKHESDVSGENSSSLNNAERIDAHSQHQPTMVTLLEIRSRVGASVLEEVTLETVI